MTRHLGVPFTGFTPEERNQYRVIVVNVNAILDEDGKLCPSALKALWNLKKSGRTIVLMTGDSASTATVYLKQWPIDGVIAENGALLVSHGKKGEVHHSVNPAIHKERVLLKRINLMNMTKGLTYASDQAGRIYDIAYDKSKLTSPEKRILSNTFLSLGARSLETNAYIHAWFGEYDRKQALKHFLQGPLELQEEYYFEHGFYLGADKEDEILFDCFQTSIGIHHVEEKRNLFSLLPTYITDGSRNDGFCEVTKALLGL